MFMEELRVLVLSHLYPNNQDAIRGIFAHQHFKQVRQEGAELLVVSPVPYSPRLLWFRKKWRSYGRVWKKNVFDEIEVHYPRFVRLPGLHFHALAGFSLYYSIKFYIVQLYKVFKFNLIHANTLVPDGFAGVLLGKKFRVPSICTVLGSDLNTCPFIGQGALTATRWVIGNTDQLVTVSESLKEKANLLGAPGKPVRVIHTGLDPEIFNFREGDSEAAREKLRLPPSGAIILFVGGLCVEKGVYELLEALEGLVEQFPDLLLAMVGSGDEEPKIKNIISQKGLLKNIILAGFRPNSEVAQWMKACDILVLPSYHEGIPNVVVEAMACARPVVATRIDGIPEVVSHNKTGFLVERQNAGELKEALEKLLFNQPLRKAMGFKGQAFIREHFSWKKSALDNIELYHEVLASHHKRSIRQGIGEQ